MLEHLRLSRRLTVSVRSYLATRPSRCVLGRGQGLGASTRPTSVFCCLATRWYSELRTQRIYAALLVEADCLLLPVTGQCTGLQLDTATSLAARVMHQTMRSSRASGCRGLCASGNTRDTLPAITALRTERSLEHLAMTERSCRLTSTSVPRPIVSSWHDQQCTSYRGPAAVEAVAPHSQASTPPPDSSADRPRARLVVFVSGGGSNFKALHAACLDGSIHADVVAVVSDIPSCGGIAYAASLGIPTLTFPIPKSKAFEGLTVAQLVEALQVTHKADYVLLAGFLKLIPLALVQAFPRAMLNIHPALLPAFGGKGCYGEKVHQAVIAAGVRYTGATVHFVDEEFDSGAILAQRVVPVYPTDTYPQVAKRVLKQEHSMYPEAVAALVDGRVTWRADGVPIIWTAA